jgi:phosphoribosylamine--glycine ligase
MGATCPSPVVDARMMATIEREILVPTIDALRREGVEYRGVLYAGLMLTHGGPKVLEFNVRFGDPECQCLVRRISGDFARLLQATATGRLHELDDDAFGFDEGHVCCVVLASAGYPGEFATGARIEGVEAAEAVEGVTVFHAGTKREKGGALVTAGGRVLDVVGKGSTPAEARERAYAAAEVIRFEGRTMRRDVGAAPVVSARRGAAV